VASSERSFAARPENVRQARGAVIDLARRAGVPAEILDAVSLAVSEAVSNAVLHAFRDGSPGRVTVATDAEDSRLRVVVRDDGCGMAPHVGSPGAGLGLPLIAELSDSVSVQPAQPGRGTEVCMTFRLPVAVAG
jgi:serine/threonine-protein kinase RsbW